MFATEMKRVPAPKIFRFKRWNRYRFGPQICKGRPQPRKICGVGEDDKICIAAKLGRAVKHARLSAHEQGADAT